MSSPFTSSPLFLVVGPSLTMTAQSKKSRTACLLARVETWAPRRQTMRSGGLEVWITGEGPCPSARKLSSAHQSTHCSRSQHKLQPSVVFSALLSLITIHRKDFISCLLIPESSLCSCCWQVHPCRLPRQTKLLFPSPSPLQEDLRGQQEDSVLAGHLCTCDQQC